MLKMVSGMSVAVILQTTLETSNDGNASESDFCEISSSASEADFCDTSDDEDAEQLQVLLDETYNYSPSLFKYLNIDPVYQTSLLFFDKDLYEHESNSSYESDISSTPGCTNGCAIEEDSQGNCIVHLTCSLYTGL